MRALCREEISERRWFLRENLREYQQGTGGPAGPPQVARVYPQVPGQNETEDQRSTYLWEFFANLMGGEQGVPQEVFTVSTRTQVTHLRIRALKVLSWTKVQHFFRSTANQSTRLIEINYHNKLHKLYHGSETQDGFVSFLRRTLSDFQDTYNRYTNNSFKDNSQREIVLIWKSIP